MSNRCDSLESENDRLRGMLSGVMSRLEHLERSTCAGDVIISGLPESSGEDLRTTVQSIDSVLNTVLDKSAILDAHRFGVAISDVSLRPRSILVRLSSGVLRNRLIGHKHGRGVLLARDVPGLGPVAGSGRLYINEGLPPFTRRFLEETRKCVTQCGW